MTDLRRIAIDPSGKLGSLYDAQRDRIVAHSLIDDKAQLDSQEIIIEGSLKYGNDEQPQNLFHQISLDTHLTLSILLKLTSNEHIASIIDYPYETDQHTRLLCYSQINRKQCLSDNNREAIDSILLPQDLYKATHIVTGIEYGLHMVIVLQLPTDPEKSKALDQIIHKLLSILSENSDTSEVSQDEKNLLKDIVHFKTYMNIPFNNEFTTVYDVCFYVKREARKCTSHPIYYRLRPLTSLFRDIQNKTCEFTIIPYTVANRIEDYALLLLAKIKQFKIQRRGFDENELRKKLQELSDLIIKFRSGQDTTIEIEQLLNTNEINILLLGETGVGKSTFINAFANYLTFDSLEDAKQNKPVVLMPVSFLITTGDNFDEHLVKFGNTDEFNTEDFEHPGQSVTQQCRSYEFTTNKKTKIRIIDTPGFGDTRGVEQDEYNMKNITDYINRLPHLNAVCLLLKPNGSRLNIFYRTCLLQFYSLMKARFPTQKVAFCFTNARSTFYTPGDTVPLLKEMLNTISDDKIFFKKENAFCFDSESFRYLVSLKNNIHFEELQEKKFQMSWTKSVAESKRFIQYLCENN